jgi:septal ring factor EnvC (AmiA/AmiB activator)
LTTPAGPPPGAPLDALPPDAPATVEDVRATRRWTWVALAWAAAASAVAVIALVTTNQEKTNASAQAPAAADLRARVAQLEKQTNDRLDAFNRRLGAKAPAADLQKLDKRLTTVEQDLAKAAKAETAQADAITKLQADVKDLQTRVQKLEQQSSTGTTTTP